MENNIHVLPTDNPGRLYLTTHEYIFEKGYALSTDECQNKNIFITSDEKFNRDEYVTDGVEVIKATPKLVDAQGLVDRRDWKKIILTTDQDLIKDGVQAIDDEFLEWFVKNPSCERVEIERVPFYIKGDYQYHINKIIIPKTRQQVIDEDFAGGLDMGQIIPKEERTYTEEDVKNAFLDGWQLRDGDLPFPKAKKKWFNEFKNK